MWLSASVLLIWIYFCFTIFVGTLVYITTLAVGKKKEEVWLRNVKWNLLSGSGLLLHFTVYIYFVILPFFFIFILLCLGFYYALGEVKFVCYYTYGYEIGVMENKINSSRCIYFKKLYVLHFEWYTEGSENNKFSNRKVHGLVGL